MNKRRRFRAKRRRRDARHPTIVSARITFRADAFERLFPVRCDLFYSLGMVLDTRLRIVQT